MPPGFFSDLAAELYPLSQVRTYELICTREYTRQLLEDLRFSTGTVLFASCILARVASTIDTWHNSSSLHPRGHCGRRKILAALLVASKGRREVVWSIEQLTQKIKVQPDIIIRDEQELQTELCKIMSDSQFDPNPMPIVYKIQKALSFSGIERHFHLALRSAEAFSLPPKTLQPDVSTQPFTRLPDFPISETFKFTVKQPRPNRRNTERSPFKIGRSLVGGINMGARWKRQTSPLKIPL